jgi:hypothetical protein
MSGGGGGAAGPAAGAGRRGLGPVTRVEGFAPSRPRGQRSSLATYAMETTYGGSQYRVEIDLFHDAVFVIPLNQVSLTDLIIGARTARGGGLGGWW